MKTKRNIVVLVLVVLLGLVGFVAYQYIRSFQDVSVVIKNPAGSVKLQLFAAEEVDHNLKPIGDALRTITTDETFSIKKGAYVLVPSGENIDTAPLSFVLADKPVTQTIDLPYTQSYLEQLASQELPAITAALTAEYPKVATDYTLNPGKLYHRGEWYGTTIANKQGTEEYIFGDTLRVLLEKQNGQWVVLSEPPEIILTTPVYKNVPVEVLRDINSL
jgi:hypothetical protein